MLAEWGEDAAEDRDEYVAENIFWVPPEARWAHLKDAARQPAIGRIVDDAMAAIEHDNPVLRDVLPKDYARPAQPYFLSLLGEPLAPSLDRESFALSAWA